MPDNDLFRRSFDAGVAFTQLTRKRAETLVRDLVKNGEVSRDQASARVEELLERSRQNSEAIIAIVRKEIDDRIAALNLVTRDDLTNLASKLGVPGVAGRAKPATSATTPAPKSTAATRAPVTNTPAAKAPVTKAPASKAPATKAGVPNGPAIKGRATSSAPAAHPAPSAAKKVTKSVKKA